MAKITYIEFNGAKHSVDVSPGLSVMEGAIRNDVPGIDADCGGACACGTCHVYVDSHWAEVIGPASEMEAAMLEETQGVEPNSRLSCQITVSEAMDGLVIRMPKSQH